MGVHVFLVRNVSKALTKNSVTTQQRFRMMIFVDSLIFLTSTSDCSPCLLRSENALDLNYIYIVLLSLIITVKSAEDMGRLSPHIVAKIFREPRYHLLQCSVKLGPLLNSSYWFCQNCMVSSDTRLTHKQGICRLYWSTAKIHFTTSNL